MLLSGAITGFRSFLSRFRSGEKAVQGVLFLPTEYFFCRYLAVPNEFNKDDVEELVRTHLEHLSPFPITQLLWGFICDDQAPGVLIYAAYQDRVKSLMQSWRDALNVFPAFLPAYGQLYERATVSFFLNGQSLCALFWEPSNPIPIRVDSIEVKNVQQPGDFVGARAAYIASHDLSNWEVEEGIREAAAPTLTLQNTLQFWECQYAEGQEGKLIRRWGIGESDSMLWRADVRDDTYINREQRNRRIAHYLWLSTIAVYVLIGVLMVGQLAFWGEKLIVARQKARKNKQAAQMARIENWDYLANKIDQITNQELLPFAMLDVLNRFRPKTVYFTSVVAEKVNGITIEGKAENTNELNVYREKLLASSLFEQVELTRITSQSGYTTTFTLVCDFKPEALKAAQPKKAS